MEVVSGAEVSVSTEKYRDGIVWKVSGIGVVAEEKVPSVRIAGGRSTVALRV